MNYFAHGMHYVDRPYFLAGTAIPDWLTVADRSVRVRHEHAEKSVDGSASIDDELARGVLQHIADDRWFHCTPAFYEATGLVSRLFADALGGEDGFRFGFLGHITTELLLDRVLIERDPGLLDAYYAAVACVDPTRVEQAVNRMSGKNTTQLALFIPLFHREQFLRDYLEAARLLYRLNQVMRRIKLNRLPDTVEQILEPALKIVQDRAGQLLPDRF